MLPFNEEFQTGESKITQVRLEVLLNNGTLLSLTEEHVMLGGLTRDSSTTVNGAFTVGAAVTGKLTVILDNSDQSLSAYDFRAAVITASLGGQLSDGNYELIRIGIYTVDEYTYDGSNITLTAYDNFHKFDLPCSESSVTFPQTITQLITQACSLAGVTLANTSIPNGSYSVTEQPESWDTMTWHDVVSYCAQIGCCFARILPNGKLFLSWYNVASLPGGQYDGGTFDTETTPYSDGAALDGGDFTYSETVDISGGEFGDRDDVTIIGSIFDLSVDTDDVLITGVTVTLAATNNIEATEGTADYEKTLGTAGYVIRIENNPLIETTANADAVCAYLYDYLVGMRFRPLNASIPENPALEAGDVALVVDRYNNTYTSFLSHVTYTTNSSTQISCDAESTMQNLKARYSEAQKTRAMAQRVYNKAMSNAEDAMFTITTAIATTMGLYPYPVSDGQGGTIYIFGNKNTLASSDIQWKFTAGALMVSNDYGATWNGAISSAGQAVLQEIYAVKVNADNIQAGHLSANRIQGGTLTLGGNDNTNCILEMFNSSGDRVGRWDNSGLYLGNITSDLTDPNTSIGIGGAISTNSLTADDYVYVNGNSSSYFNIPMGSVAYTRVSASGFHVKDAWNNDIFVENTNFNERGFRVRPSNASGTSSQEGATLSGSSLFIMGVSRHDYAAIDYDEIRLTKASDSFPMFLATLNGYNQYTGKRVMISGAEFSVTGGTKNRVVETEHYAKRTLTCYEMPSPMFGDIGEGAIGEDGLCYVSLDPIFAETISKDCAYQVFLQKYGEGECYVSERKPTYFIVVGEPNLNFAWELKAKQIDFDQQRLQIFEEPIIKEAGEEKELDYGTRAMLHIRSIINERGLSND